MGESFVWPEGNVYLWTGSASSALVAYAEQTNVRMAYGYYNSRSLDLAYHDTLTGQRVDVTVGSLYCPDASALQRMFDAKTAVHAHFKHALTGGAAGSAGHFLYSGRMDALQVAGQDGNAYRLLMTYHANIWSAYP